MATAYGEIQGLNVDVMLGWQKVRGGEEMYHPHCMQIVLQGGTLRHATIKSPANSPRCERGGFAQALSTWLGY
jgi:hypothetical protein